MSENRFLKHAFAKSEESPGRKKKNIKGKHDLVVAEGSDPYQNTIKGIEAIGGMNQFVKKDAVVVIKPNIGWDRTPEQGANTDPHVVAALVELCYTAGAKRVNVFDVTCDEAKRCYDNSGIRKAAEAKGAKVYFADHWNVVKAKFPYESSMADWKVLRDAVECDTFINVPVLKHHGLTGLTLSMKNLMGVCSGIRGMMHMGIGRKLADLTDFISPDLTVIDATRVLTKHGPQGGNIADVIQVNKVIVSTDPVLADAYAASLMKKEPLSIPYISEAVARNLGSADLVKADVVNVKV
ncbi:MAG: hypothetical protein A3G33_02585 [Omnitrophica bacterium RIFCSPLOWO2_12_FULL_44_17]|uniref:DUF362 domain-containing protein n=1 Tax=Candidatus Danuiimicrobium aquiferis TaxID=1801832 RepID=A0A1G1KZQ0_9BACT|nr:MAG: hypothetical protein A3B72_08075 [Omnitrophica bacterium RIFCSPHIGHO2_02_FULL_45_28]OGW89458.1 MAG: hypothetical protein A3E74_07550 [Omnitrophica bacterium RIFCSPHIGHO2_12_FULL_44_12]OGW98351.1 MAG: hypothetical protein A3G33_02585 [Omnitrophica bacterium RIFCSPLOWO2_12_FULL_44_17]OGX02909.1 MAG: hypothetical protein A3J12_05090 [Omnitrophica bacterium RIFCSPLOWO2_02_FULL_44_11]